ncbi:MAG: DUF3137 domain-containing protein [Tannerellaceae bacterium]|jgi:hypothetical protein|nr:DUF3137 domain-containing protein [Tannerellaceae bacterium]
MNRAEIDELQRELSNTLSRTALSRKRLNLARAICYGGALIWFAAIILLQVYLYGGGDVSFLYTIDPEASFFERYKALIFVAPLFILILIGGVGLGIFYNKFDEEERIIVRRVVRKLFPEASLSLEPFELPASLMERSNFFGCIRRQELSGYSLGSIRFETDARAIIFRDIIVNFGKSRRILAQSGVGSIVIILKMMLKGLFGNRIENAAADFRGLFADAKLERSVSASVVILPDALERRLDYLAAAIQSLRNVNGNKLVKLEDPEFERRFAVYADDEIAARYILTPAMMQRITELHDRFRREVMLSFSGDKFYFATSMPGGFLTLGQSRQASGESLANLYENINAARSILGDLKLR